ncbi:MAG: cobalt-precorrin 5A hydrolase [Candidatus Electrothrix aestuarii]|uniref:Cobalt-precorrin 5A hydrolase n=1 Tax=Candidatus Electrothrix aestuarii TaxID=3062594 RepID=A0AAU8LP46_9BACT|nr:cobalt-precorrin 5A hydrolase [Candidatus Electrothrix aestuarii]
MSTHTAIIALTKGGKQLAQRLASLLPASEVVSNKDGIHHTLAQVWQNYDSLICIMATGIVVRGIAPLLQDKTVDPAVVVCDEKGQFAISLLSGHLGGGNALAQQVADLLGGQAVITTASDVLGRTALDLWCRDMGLVVNDKQGLTRVMAKLVNTGTVSLYSDYPLPPLPPDIVLTDLPDGADLLITCRTDWKGNAVLLHPKALVAGIGCNRNTPTEEIKEALKQACQAHQLARESVRQLASIDLKSDEPGLLAFAQSHNLPLDFYSPEQLNQVEGIEGSDIVLRITGAKAVAEPAAILGADNGSLLVQKIKSPNVTVAIAEHRCPFRSDS